MIKVCFSNLNAYSLFNPKSEAPIGGTEIQLFNVANYLVQNKEFEIFFVVGDWGQSNVEKYKRIRVYKSASLEKKIGNYIKAPFLIWNSLNKINADIYIASSAGAEIGLIAFFCKIKGKKFIYRTAHDIDCNEEFIKNNGVVGKIFEYGIKNASKIVVQNERNHAMMKHNYGVISGIIFNSWNLNQNKENAIKNYILWVGRCVQWKNPKLFLKVVSNLPNFEFIMICPKQKNQIKFYEKIKKESEEFRNIKFIESIPFLEIQEYFNKAKLFVGTSEHEGFPNTYIQSCIGRTPIISYKVNPDDFIKNNRVGYCSDGDFDLMLNQIKKILSDEKDWKIKSENAYKYVKKNHDIRVIGKKWEKVIQGLI